MDFAVRADFFAAFRREAEEEVGSFPLLACEALVGFSFESPGELVDLYAGLEGDFSESGLGDALSLITYSR